VPSGHPARWAGSRSETSAARFGAGDLSLPVVALMKGDGGVGAVLFTLII